MDLTKLQTLIESESDKQGTKFYRMLQYDKYGLFAELTETDCGFSLVLSQSGDLIFGASTDGVTTKIYPKGIIKANDKTSFNKWIKDWREQMLEKRKEEIYTALEGLPSNE